MYFLFGKQANVLSVKNSGGQFPEVTCGKMHFHDI